MQEASTTTTHSDPERPAFGHEPGHPFNRAMAAKERAGWRVEHAAERIAEMAVAGYLPEEYEASRYAKAKAGKQYAEAVYEVEAAKVRAA